MSELSETFAALGDATRLAIVERLLELGEASAGELGSVAEVSAPAISRHLRVLREAGIITRRVDAQRRIYAVRPAALRRIGDWMIAHEAFWNASLARLAAALDEEEERDG